MPKMPKEKAEGYLRECEALIAEYTRLRRPKDVESQKKRQERLKDLISRYRTGPGTSPEADTPLTVLKEML